MSKNKKVRRKIKQVASRAKATSDSKTRIASVITQAERAIASEEQQSAADKNVVVLGGEFEFSTDSTEQQRKIALERSKKVDLKSEIKSMLAAFKEEVNGKLAELTTRIEDQLRPMVQIVAEVALAKSEFGTKLSIFEDRLGAVLDLNDELEPIEIAEMFSLPGSELDAEMSTYGTEGTNSGDEDDIELLTEVVTEDDSETDSVN